MILIETLKLEGTPQRIVDIPGSRRCTNLNHNYTCPYFTFHENPSILGYSVHNQTSSVAFLHGHPAAQHRCRVVSTKISRT